MSFFQKFNTYSSKELLKILDNPDDYQETAIETAQKILSERNLSEKEIALYKIEIKNEKLEESEEDNSIFDKTNNYFIKRTNVILNILTIIFSLLLIYKLLPLITFAILYINRSEETDIIIYWAYYQSLIFAPLLISILLNPSILLIAIIKFLKRKKSGWILIFIYLTYSGITHLFGFLNIEKSLFNYIANIKTNVEFKTSYEDLIMTLFYGIMIWVITRKSISDVYFIKNNTSTLE